MPAYQELSGRTVIRGQLPEARINLRTKTPLNRIQLLQVLDSVLAFDARVLTSVRQDFIEMSRATVGGEG